MAKAAQKLGGGSLGSTVSELQFVFSLTVQLSPRDGNASSDLFSLS